MTGLREHRRAQPRPARHATRWERVWHGDGESQAAIVAGALDARGIRTRVTGSRAVSHAYPLALSQGNWAVHVPAHQAQAARDHLVDSGESANVVQGGPAAGDHLFVLKLAITGVLALVVITVLGVLFSGWGA